MSRRDMDAAVQALIDSDDDAAAADVVADLFSKFGRKTVEKALERHRATLDKDRRDTQTSRGALDYFMTGMEQGDSTTPRGLFAPTRTHGDALLTRKVIAEFAESRHATVIEQRAMSTLTSIGESGDQKYLDVERKLWNAPGDPHAALIYLAAELCQPIRDSAETVPVPDDITDLQIREAGLVVFGETIRIGEIDCSAVAWAVVGGGIITQPWAAANADEDLPYPIVPRFFPTAEINREAFRFLVAMFAWMDGVVEAKDEPAARPTRRKVERAGQEPKLVTHLKLRKLEQKEWDANRASESGREYSHRWVVSPHWRNVRCGPGRSRTRPVFIAPYIAGPPDKPLIADKDRIWRVDR